MQTFLTYKSFSATAADLDNARLNKQLLEGRQILAALAGKTKGWVNHPATKMWAGAEITLFSYLYSMMLEMDSRGIAWEKNWSAIGTLIQEFPSSPAPDWYSDPVSLDRIITSHRASLYNKSQELYPQFEFESSFVEANRWDVLCCGPYRKPNVCNYWWPTHVK